MPKILMKSLLALFVGVLTFFGTPALAAQASCPPPWTDGWVQDKNVAKAIYLAVGRARHMPQFDKYPVVVVEDGGNHWTVSQTNGQSGVITSGRTISVTLGGGQLRMNIDKCNGAISEAWLAK